MKKGLISLLLLTLVAFFAAGCGNNNNEGNTNTENNATENNDTGNNEAAGGGEAVTLKFAAQNDTTPATQAAIDAFNKSQDKYKVEWVTMTNDSAQMHDQLLTSLSSGNAEYDIISMDVVWAGEFAGGGYLEPLDMHMRDANYSKDQFNSGSMASGNYKGKQYTLPFFPDLGLLYFRKDLVSEDDSTKLVSGDYTYEDLGNMAAKYKQEAGTKYGFVYQSKQYEGLTVNVTEFSNHFQDTKAGLQTMYNFTKADWAPENLLTFTEGETATEFEKGNAVFARNWPYMYGDILNPDKSGATTKPEQVNVAPLPNGGSVGGWLLGINKSSKNIDGAWEFVKFLAGPEGQKIMSTKGGYLPGYNELLKDQEVLDANKMLTMEGFQNALKTTIARPVSPEYSKVSDTIQIAAHKYLSSGEGLDDAVSKIDSAVNQ